MRARLALGRVGYDPGPSLEGAPIRKRSLISSDRSLTSQFSPVPPSRRRGGEDTEQSEASEETTASETELSYTPAAPIPEEPASSEAQDEPEAATEATTKAESEFTDEHTDRRYLKLGDLDGTETDSDTKDKPFFLDHDASRVPTEWTWDDAEGVGTGLPDLNDLESAVDTLVDPPTLDETLPPDQERVPGPVVEDEAESSWMETGELAIQTAREMTALLDAQDRLRERMNVQTMAAASLGLVLGMLLGWWLI